MANHTGINRTHLIHKAVELRNCSGKFQKRFPDVQAVFDSGYIAQPKLDGVNGFAVVRGESAELFTRTGDRVRSCAHLCAFLALLPDAVYLGEIWHPSKPQSEISGLARQHSPSPDLQFWLFDSIGLGAFSEGYDPRPYFERHASIPADLYSDTLALGRLVYSLPLHDLVMTEARALRPFGCDGIILRDPEAAWTAGAGKGGEIIKAKPLMTFDLLCTGTYPGEGKYSGMIGGLLFRWANGRELRVGTGLDDAQRAADPSAYVGKIFEVAAMDYSADGLLREPRLHGERHDKTSPDY